MHISGMGLIGSFVAWELWRKDVTFTWDDNDTPHNAWGASAGAVMSYSDQDTSFRAEAYRFWQHPAQHYDELNGLLEPVTAVYVLKSRPDWAKQHGVKPVATTGDRSVWVKPWTAWQLNVQGFVLRTRRAFRAQRVATNPGEGLRLLCRGIGNESSTTPCWGWTAGVTVTLKTAGCPFWEAGGFRPSIQLKDPAQPFARACLHPLGGVVDQWTAGSAKILQKRPVQLKTEQAVKDTHRHAELMEQYLGEWLTIQYQFNQIVEGWRPETRNRSLVGSVCSQIIPTEAWEVEPARMSGVQYGPLMARRIVEKLFPNA